MILIKTKAGLPNNCSVCAKPIKGEWYAANEDMARSGQGFCTKKCANPPAPKAKSPSEDQAPPNAEAPEQDSG